MELGAVALLAACFSASCSGTDQGPKFGQGGGSQGGGAPGMGGSTNGAGGTTIALVGGATSGPNGGMVNAGGVQQAGGASGSGGKPTSGGTTSTGGARTTGGVPSTGGTSSSSGGSIPVGGSLGTGGSKATGGSISTGGRVASTGGTNATGGAVSTGGSKATGGATNTGGVPATGGSRATGGAVSTGGSKATGGAGMGGSTSTHTGQWKIMMLGDSITATTCYPPHVFQDLKNAGHTNFAFIGGVPCSQGSNCSGVTGIPSGGLRTEGHSGETVAADKDTALTWFQANKPDIVVMHFGTNDVWGNPSTATANTVISGYTTILGHLRAVNPNAILFVAQIIPMNPNPYGTCSASAPCHYEANLDAAIPAWAAANSTAASPIYVVNLENLYPSGYFAGTTYTTDGVHPTDVGSQPMGTTVSAAMIAHVPTL